MGSGGYYPILDRAPKGRHEGREAVAWKRAALRKAPLLLPPRARHRDATWTCSSRCRGASTSTPFITTAPRRSRTEDTHIGQLNAGDRESSHEVAPEPEPDSGGNYGAQSPSGRTTPTADAVEDTGIELKSFDDLKDLLPSNARDLKRLVNNHRLMKLLLQARGTTWTDERQRALVLWALTCFRWGSDVASHLEAQPTAAARPRSKKPAAQPDLLAALVKANVITGIDKKAIDRLRADDKLPVLTTRAVRDQRMDEVARRCGLL